jgi:arylsulfatase A-like enzyme
MRFDFWLPLLGLAPLVAGWANASHAAPPNVLLVMTDDQGYGDIGSHGNPYLKTPNLDAFADSGARFERFFVSPVCAPTRASLLTGRYHLRTGVCGVTRGYENMRENEITLAEILHDAGYATGIFGKWHNGRHMPLHPNGQGFDEFLGFCGGHWNTYFDPPLERNGEPVETDGYIADVLTDAAIDFIDRNAGRPWFCYVPLNTPHSPWRVADDLWAKYEGLGLDPQAQCAYAMVDNIDRNFGRLLVALDQHKLADRTIVLFLTDNGANSDRFNAGMKGRKASVDEGGVRVPLFVRYPGVIAPRTTVQPIAAHFDLLPTLAEFCGVKLTDEHQRRLDGVSLVPLLTGASPANPWPDRKVFTDSYRPGQTALDVKASVRTQQWRAVKTRDRWQLFDMQADPGQTTDVAAKHPALVAELSQAFTTWFDDVTRETPGDITIPVGHPARGVYELPANEAVLQSGKAGGLRYTGDNNSGYANSWLTDWTDPAARPEWQYTCRAEDAGIPLRIEFQGVAATPTDTPPERIVLTGKVATAFDPPLLPKPDRIPSDNYQDKADWGTLALGEVSLPAGKHRVVVRMENIPGRQGIDLKSVRLTRVPK